jgi:hypothetical protein
VYEKEHAGDEEKEKAGGSKRKGSEAGGEPKAKSAKKPDTRLVSCQPGFIKTCIQYNGLMEGETVHYRRHVKLE